MANPYRRVQQRAILTSLIFALFTPASTWADITITLNKDFIDKFKNRATIDATYSIDQAHKQPNSAAKDGDIHIAGRAPEISLAAVAEVMNAAAQLSARTLVKVSTGGDPVKMTGAWRIWCEHGGDVEHIQGSPLEPFDTTNPPHVFEIHPLTRLNNVSVTSGWKPIVGFTAKDAEQAFLNYERTRSRIVPGDETITIVTTMAGFNYTEFRIELTEDPVKVEDGLMTFATVMDLRGNELVHKRRMVFVDGTPPAQKVAALKMGATLHVLGLPRISLTLVEFRATHASDPQFKDKDILNWSLPYEMIIAAVYPD